MIIDYNSPEMLPQKTRYTDYSKELPHLDFKYDDYYHPMDGDLPDPQVDPVLPGARMPIQKVGVGPLELPLRILQRDGGTQEVYARASLYGSLDDPHAKGLNFSRFYAVMHDSLENHTSVEALKDTLRTMSEKQKCTNSYCKIRFHYRWTQDALRSRLPLSTYEESSCDYQRLEDGTKISLKKRQSHIFYNCTLEGQLLGSQYKFFLTVEYRYGSTCPCSFALAQHATQTRGKAANGHSQRSIATIKVEIDPEKLVWIEDVVEMARRQIPTETQIFMKRLDEQAQAELSGSNLLFTEDASRLLYEGLDDLYDRGYVKDFSVVTCHQESIHPYDVYAVMYKGIPDGLR